MTVQPDMLLAIILILLGIACLTLLIVLIVRQGAHHRSLIQMQQNQMMQLDHTIRACEDDLADETAAQRDELLRSVAQMREELVHVFSDMSHAQADQVNALLRQDSEHMNAFEQRQANLQDALDTDLQRFEERVLASLNQNENRVQALREAVQSQLGLLRTENAQKLEEMRKTVDEKLNDTLEKRLNESFSQVSTHLEQVYRSLGEMHTLASGVGDLKKILSNVKTRGIWGEVQLGALLEQALTETQYRKNVAVCPGSAERVEFAICLPGREENGKPVLLPIDSKFPQEDYMRLMKASEEGDASATEAAQQALLSAVKTEAKRIGKYIVPPYTTDFAVMFLPTEGLYAEVMRNAETVESIQRQQRILIAGPSTLLALLNSLQIGFRTLAIEKRSAEVWKMLGTVKNDFGSFALLLQKTQEKLQQATDSIDTAFAKTRSIEKHLRSVELPEGPMPQNSLPEESPKE